MLERVRFTSNLLEDAQSEPPIDPLAASLRSRRILVAEDGETNRKLIQLFLQRSGAEVVLVENGLDAIVAASHSIFDLILLDMQMPVLDGYAAARQLRATGFTKPIVALTAHTTREDEDRCIAAGCSGYLAKPIRQELLLTRLFALINGEVIDVNDQPKLPSKCNFGPLVSELPIDNPSFAELIGEFIERAHEKLTELRMAHSTNNNEQMAKLAHWMKGSGGMAGFPILTEIARELECFVKKTDIKAIENCLSVLESLVGRMQSPTYQSG